MKKLFSLVLVLILAFSFVSCTQINVKKLDTPDHLRLNGSILSWNPVDYASKYNVKISSEIIESSVTTFDLSTYTGEEFYNITVQAVGDGINFSNSDWSSNLTYQPNNSITTEEITTENNEITPVVQTKSKYVKTNLYVADQVEDGMKFDCAVSYEENINFYSFYLGTISSTPLFVSTAKQYSVEGTTFTAEFSTVTSTTVTNSVSQAVETIDTHSYTGGFEIGGSTEGEANVIFAKAKVTISAKTDHHWTNNWGSTKTISEVYTESYIETITEAYSIQYAFNDEGGFQKGRSYREALVQTIDVYVIVAHDTNNDTYSFEYQTYVEEDNDLVFITQESDEYGRFENETPNTVLDFDLNQAISIIGTLGDVDDIIYSEINDAAHILGFDGGDGSEENPYIIGGRWADSYQQFLSINQYLDKSFILETDINLSSYSSDNYNAVIKGNYTGCFDGNGNRIYGLQLNLTYQNVRPNEGYGFDYQIGLFEHLGDPNEQLIGTIKNLVIDDFNIDFDAYHENDSIYYAFGLLVATNDGLLDNITIKNSELHAKRIVASSGLITSQNRGEIRNSLVTDCYLKVNADGGGITGRNYGLIYNSDVTNTTLYYYQVEEYEKSMGGIAGYQKNLDGYPIAEIDSCNVYNNLFQLHNEDESGWNGDNDPKLGYVVGHIDSGRLYSVGSSDSNTREITNDRNGGDYYFKVGWGYAGKIGENVDVK